jgi:hypothetical protein
LVLKRLQPIIERDLAMTQPPMRPLPSAHGGGMEGKYGEKEGLGTARKMSGTLAIEVS